MQSSIKKRRKTKEEPNITEVKSSGKYFLRINTQKLGSRGNQDRTSRRQNQRHPGDTGFEGSKDSWRAGEVWHWQQLGKPIGKSAASVDVDDPGLKGSSRQVEAWHHEERLGEAIGKSAVQLLPKTPAFQRCQYHEMITRISRCCGVQLTSVWKTSSVPL